MDYVDFDSLAQKLAPTLQVLENKRKELLRKGRSEGLIYAAIFLVVGVIALLILKLEGIFGPIVIVVISVIIFITCIIGKIFSKDFFSLLTFIKNFREKRPFCGTAFSKLRWELQE